MLLFSTLLDINPTLTPDAFIRLAVEWNQASLNEENIIPGIVWNGERSVRYGSEENWLAVESYPARSITAIRHEKRAPNGVVWDTEFILNSAERKLSVRLDRSYADQVQEIDAAFSTPHFITLLIRDGYLADDGDLPVLREPLLLDESNLGIMADVMNGRFPYRLPVVYISKTFENEDPVNTAILAGRLKGVAHVLVQKSPGTNAALRQASDGRNEYNGAIGIYFPNGEPAHKRYLFRGADGYDDFLMERIIRQVIHYSNTQLLEPLYTWQGVSNALLRERLAAQREERLAAERSRQEAEDRIARLKEEYDEAERVFQEKALLEAKTAADALLSQFDDEMRELQNRVEELTRANDALQYENHGLRAKLEASDRLPILYMGDEFEFYAGEVKELLLSVLEDAIPNLTQGSRRSDVVNDIIENNNYLRVSRDRANEIKRLMKGYTGLSGKLSQELERFGFRITGDGKHYKLVYYGDNRYQVTVAKTPSDVRSGMNDAQVIIRKVL